MLPSNIRWAQAMALPLILLLSRAVAAEMVDHFTDLGFANPVSTLQHPSAEYYNGVTYIAYQGPHEDPYVCAYNHADKMWSGPVRAGENIMGHTPDPTDPGKADNHGRPAMIVDGQGHLHLVFGGHGGYWRLGKNTLGTPGQGKQTHVVSRNPEDISSWEVLDNITPFGTYSQFVKMDDGDIYLFYRHGSHRSDWVYQKSTDNCRTFAPPVSILKHQVREDDPNTHDAWYAWFDNGLGDTITATYVYHPCKLRGHTKERYNGYYMKLNCQDDSWENVKGEALALPVTKEYADEKTRVCDTGSERSNHGTCRVDEDGHPHLFFRQGPGQVRYYRWLGNAWQAPVAVTGEDSSQDGDMMADSPEHIRMLLTHRAPDGGGEVCWWETTDGGLTWAKGACLIASPTMGFDVGALVRNGLPEGRMVAAGNPREAQHLYRKLFLIGDDGPVQRIEEEASQPEALQKLFEASKAARAVDHTGKKKHNKTGEASNDDE